MADEVLASGLVAGGASVYDRIEVQVRSDERWIYVEARHGSVRVFSGQPCPKCKRLGTRYVRCKAHAGAMAIAVQLDLI